MKHFYSILVALGLVLATTHAFAADATGIFGNSAAKADQDLTIMDMLTYAIQDEYLARAEYAAIMAQFGTARPFTNIKKPKAPTSPG